jgi:poly(3-hydroxybutyrate) depolymerase
MLRPGCLLALLGSYCAESAKCQAFLWRDALGIAGSYYIRFMKNLFLLASAVVGMSYMTFGQCEDGRYRDIIFTNVDIISDVEYGANISHDGVNTPLLLDVFSPANDVEVLRPLVVLAHGGFFVAGSKEGTDVVPTCVDLAKMGYVTASINYRLGFPSTLNLAGPMTEAVMRGVQDMKAAVRYFRSTVEEQGNPYGIDPNQIYIGGFSAGGFISLHYAYLQDDEIPSMVNQNANGLAGGVEGQSGHADYSSAVNAIINIAGAIGDTTWIDAGELPALLAHGTADSVVPFDSDMLTIQGFLPVSQVDGSNSIDQKLSELEIEHCFEIYELQGHVPSVTNQAYYDTTLSMISNFLSHFVCPNVPLDCEYRTISVGSDELQASDKTMVFPIPADQWLWWKSDEVVEHFELYNALGARVDGGKMSGGTKCNTSELSNGIYVLRLYVGSQCIDKKVLIQHQY